MDPLLRLQSWYKTQCNGDWEHTYGVKIETLDNPGWALKIDLTLTPLEKLELNLSGNNSDLDWYEITIRNSLFVGYADPDKLNFLIEFFLDEIVPKYSDPVFEYPILLPLAGAPVNVWINAIGTMNNDNKLTITWIEEPNIKTMLCESLDNIESWIHHFDQFQLIYQVGDIIETSLVMTFQGVFLAKK